MGLINFIKNDPFCPTLYFCTINVCSQQIRCWTAGVLVKCMSYLRCISISRVRRRQRQTRSLRVSHS